MKCPTCNGAGRHSRALGCITQEQWERDWDEDEREAYVSGAYDKTCSDCRGTGRVSKTRLAEMADERQDRRTRAMEDDVPFTD